MQVCANCGLEKPVDEFNWHKTDKELRYAWCKTCWNAANKMRYVKDKQYYQSKANERKRKLREFVTNYKVERGCQDCGESHPATLDLHHLDASRKSENVSTMLVRGWGLERIKAELEKCVVLCSNCHRKRHWKS